MKEIINEKKSKNRETKQGIKLNTPFVRTKIINGNPYLYEITPYWDYQTGKQRQKSKYLGRADRPLSSADSGTLSSSSSISSSISSPTTGKTTLSKVKHQVDFGDAYLFHALVKELKLDQLLKQCFPEEEAHFILLAAGYRLLSGKSFSIRIKMPIESSEMTLLFSKRKQRLGFPSGYIPNQCSRPRYYRCTGSEIWLRSYLMPVRMN
jgi:hypothetical protein